MRLPQFQMHFYVNRAQQKYFDEVKENVKHGELVLQIDFAENYRLVFQNEIQSAHFNYKQVSIFTCVAWTSMKTESLAVISNSLNHGKAEVFLFLTKIVKYLKESHGRFEKIFLFSDGSSSQFKNKFIIDSLTNFIAEFECDTIEWNYFASSHGKGAVDGVGAVLKRKVWQMTKTKKLLLHNAFDFYECAKNHVSGIRIMYVEEGEIVISSILKKMGAVAKCSRDKENTSCFLR